jgi:hypothetical protein
MKTTTSHIARATAPALLLALTALPAPADMIDASAFSQSFGIQFPGYVGSTTLSDFPVLVKLSAATGFQYAKAAADGADLRFALEDGTLLSHEIDTWDASGTSLVWVKIPAFSATTTIKAYYGCSGILPAVSADDVWSNGFVGVWHMGDDGASQGNSVGGGAVLSEMQSGATRDSPNVTLSQTGAIGKSVAFAVGQPGALSSKDMSLSLQLRQSFTVEMWAWQDDHAPSEASSVAYLYQEMRSNYSGLFGVTERTGENAGKIVVSGGFTQQASYTWTPDSSAPLPARAAWNHLAFSFGPAGAGTNMLNGVVVRSTTSNFGMIVEDTGAVRQLFIGNQTSSATASWPGKIDELRISSVSRSVDWVKATHDCVTDDDFCAFVFDAGWEDYSMKFDVTFTGVQEGVTLASFPALVRISEAGIPGFAYSDCVLDDGHDLRFADVDGNLLASEVDTWNTNGESLVWVNVPSLTSTTKITGYYGSIRPHGMNPADVWTNGYNAVWHLGEAAAPLEESTRNATPFLEGAVAPLYAAAGAVGEAVDFSNNSSTSSRLSAADADALDGFKDFTVEFWSYQETFQTSGYGGIIAKRNGASNQESWFFYQNGASPQVDVFAFTRNGSSRYSAFASKLPESGAWTHQAFCRKLPESSGNPAIVSIFFDGVLDRRYETTDASATAAVHAGTSPLYLGGGTSQNSFPGRIDEVRISRVVRDAAWLKATHDTVTDPEFATCGKAREVANLATVVFFR